MAPEAGILLLRVALVATLYLFLLAVVLVVSRDLGRGGRAPTEPEKPPPSSLVVVRVDSSLDLQAREFALRDEGPITIGRDPSCAVELPDTFVSVTHAVLGWRDGRWWLQDLGSTNGTLVNGRPVKASTPIALAFSDVIQVGRVSLKLSRTGG